MDKEAFRKRMQALKSYREQNPGKGYIEWKESISYEDGGEVNEGKTEFFLNWYTPRVSILGKNAKERGTGLLNMFKSDESVGNQELERIIGNINRTEEVNRNTITPEQTKVVTKFINNSVSSEEPIPSDKALEYNRILNKAVTFNVNSNDSFILYNTETPSTKVHERTHAGKTYNLYNLIRNKGIKSTSDADSYLDDPKEIYSRLMEVRYNNKLNPLEIIDDKRIEELKKSGKDSNILNRYDNELLKFLFNGIAENSNSPKLNDIPTAAEGGEVPPMRKDKYGKVYTQDLVNDYYANTSDEIDRFTGSPMVKGVKSAFDLLDAADMTPVGDAISVYDTYDAIKNKMLEGLSKESNFLDYEYFAKNNRNWTREKYDDYLKMGTEIKSFMNSARRNMVEKGLLKRTSTPIDMDVLKKYMDTVPSSDGEKAVFDAFKKPSEYLKWINRIPIVNNKNKKNGQELA